MAAYLTVGFALLCTGLESAMHFDTYAMDGPFQLFNALRRISVGQRIGDTFQFFHGPGIPYLFYPAFALGGKTFLAAEVSRQAIAVALYLVSTLVICRAITRAWRHAVPMAVIATLVILEYRADGVVFPLNSLLGVRSTMPLFVAAHLYLRRPGRVADVERGLLLGLAVLLGTEQGTASIAALAVTRIAFALRRRSWRSEASAFAVELGTAAVSFVLMVAVLAGSHTASVLRFNFREVPLDQLWYFGAPPNAFLSRWSEIPRMLSSHLRWWLTLVAAVIIGLAAIRQARGTSEDREPFTTTFLCVYALISLASMLGIFILVYAIPANRVAVLVVLGWIFHRREAIYRAIPAWGARLRPIMPAIAAPALVLTIFVRQPDLAWLLVRSAVHVPRDHMTGRQPAAMSEAWIETQVTGLAEVQRLQQTLGHRPSIWSTYAGLIEWELGSFHPAMDYIIHALGPQRRALYAAEFIADRPDLVQTIRPSFVGYEEWLEGAHWDFYRPLLSDYDVSAVGPWSFFWTRAAEPPGRGEVLLNMAVPAGARAISANPHVPRDSIAVFEVRLRYHTHNPLGALPIIGGLPRYLVDLPGAANEFPVSLAPYATQRSFPIVIRGGSSISIQGRVASLVGGASLTLDSVRVERIPMSRTNAIWVNDFVDRHYLRGLSGIR